MSPTTPVSISAAAEVRGIDNRWVLEVSRFSRDARVAKGFPFQREKWEFFGNRAGTTFIQSTPSLESQLNGGQTGTANDRSWPPAAPRWSPGTDRAESTLSGLSPASAF